MTEPSKQMHLMPEADSTTSGAVECLGQTFASDAARREHYLNRLRTALEELDAKLGGVTWTTVDDAVTRLSALEHWQLGDSDRLRELAERMREASRGNGRNKDLLQLWKDEVGFPFGDLDDILRLSDPPYYTACPNPFIDEFITHYGKSYDPSTSDYRREPFATDVSEGKNDPIYNAHGYHTKVPHRAIMRYILHYTQPGDVILDGFSGTGMTGVAAQLCGNRDTVRSLGYQVDTDGSISDNQGTVFSRLGRRRAVLNDLSTAATFISYNYNTSLETRWFEREAEQILDSVRRNFSWMYLTLHQASQAHIDTVIALLDDVSQLKKADYSTTDPNFGTINYTVWSDVFVCSNCGHEVVFWEVAVDHVAGEVRDVFNCSNCNTALTKRGIERAFSSKYDDATNQTIRQAKQVPVIINYSVGTKRYEKKPDALTSP